MRFEVSLSSKIQSVFITEFIPAGIVRIMAGPGWKGKGLDTKVSLKQALKALGFAGGSKRESELNQWITAEKERLAAVMERHGIEWEQKLSLIHLSCSITSSYSFSPLK